MDNNNNVHTPSECVLSACGEPVYNVLPCDTRCMCSPHVVYNDSCLLEYVNSITGILQTVLNNNRRLEELDDHSERLRWLEAIIGNGGGSTIKYVTDVKIGNSSYLQNDERTVILPPYPTVDSLGIYDIIENNIESLLMPIQRNVTANATIIGELVNRVSVLEGNSQPSLIYEDTGAISIKIGSQKYSLDGNRNITLPPYPTVESLGISSLISAAINNIPSSGGSGVTSVKISGSSNEYANGSNVVLPKYPTVESLGINDIIEEALAVEFLDQIIPLAEPLMQAIDTNTEDIESLKLNAVTVVEVNGVSVGYLLEKTAVHYIYTFYGEPAHAIPVFNNNVLYFVVCAHHDSGWYERKMYYVFVGRTCLAIYDSELDTVPEWILNAFYENVASLIPSVINNSATKAVPSAEDNIATLSANGNLKDGGVTINQLLNRIGDLETTVDALLRSISELTYIISNSGNGENDGYGDSGESIGTLNE